MPDDPPALRFEVRGEPIGKASPRFDPAHRRTYMPAHSAQWMKMVGQIAGHYHRRPPWECPCRLLITARMAPVKAPKWKREAQLAGVIRPGKKPDGSNIQKGIEDALTGIVWRDDALVVDGRCVKEFAEVPAVIVEVWPLHEPTTLEEWNAWNNTVLQEPLPNVDEVF